MNENGDSLISMCAEKGLFLANTFFEHKMIHRYTWRREAGEVEQKSLIDYVAVDERLRSEVRDARVVRGMFQDSDHMAVLVRLGIKEKWVYKNSSESKVKRVRNELLREEQYKTLYEKELKTSWDGEEINVGDVHWVGMVAKIFSGTLIRKAEEVVGCKLVKEMGMHGGRRKLKKRWKRKRKLMI